MKILAIDQARNGGWAIFDYDTKKLLKSGSYSFPDRKYTFTQAVLGTESFIQELIAKENISAVFFEDIQLRVNVAGFKKLAQLQGVLINLCEKNNYLYYIIAPSTWQGYCGARGRTTKEKKSKTPNNKKENNTTQKKKSSKLLSIEYVKNKYGVDTDNDNMSDAICIGTYVVDNVVIHSSNE